MAAQVEMDAGRTGVVGPRLHLSPLVDSSNTSQMESPQGVLILTPEPSKPVPGPKPRLTPKPYAVEKNPTIRPILAPKPRSDSSRQAASKPDPPSTKPLLAVARASKPRPASTSTFNTTARPTSTFSTKPGSKPSPGQTSKPVAQPFKPAPPLALAEPIKPYPSHVAKKPVAAVPTLPQKRGGIQAAHTSAEWSGPTRQKPPGSTMTRAKSLGFLTDVGLTEGGQKDGGAGDGGPGTMEVTASTPVLLRTQSRGGRPRPRPMSAIFLPNSASPDTQSSGTTTNSSGSRWTGRRPLSADLTSRFEAAGLSVHHKAARADSKENTPDPIRGEQDEDEEEEEEEEEEQTRTEGVTGRREKEKERGSGDGMEDKSKASTTQERGGEGKQEEGEGREDVKGGGSIKRRISLLLDSSTLSVPGVGRTSADGVETRSSGQPTQDVDKALGVKQRIRKLTEDTPPQSSIPQHPPLGSKIALNYC